MPIVSIPALYDGENIHLLENAPTDVPYRVIVTFVEPVDEPAIAHDDSPFWASFGAWQDDRPIEDTLHDIHSARVSRSEPPVL